MHTVRLPTGTAGLHVATVCCMCTCVISAFVSLLHVCCCCMSVIVVIIAWALLHMLIFNVYTHVGCGRQHCYIHVIATYMLLLHTCYYCMGVLLHACCQ